MITILSRLARFALFFSLLVGASATTVDLLSGPYSSCPGAGCAKGDYRFGSDATVSSGSWTLTTPGGSFTSADIGKRGVALDWHAPNTTSGCWSGYACYSGVSCQFTVASITSPTSIQVSAVAGCGGSGIGFNASGNAYWAVYSDDSTPLHNALTAASGGTLTVPQSYKGGIYTGGTVPASTTISCTPGGSFWDPKLNTSTTILFNMSSNAGMHDCTIRGTEPSYGAYYDVTREYNVPISIFGGVGNVLLQNNTIQDIWGTYMIGTSGANNAHITGNTFKNCGYYAVQLNKTGGSSPNTSVDHNNAENCWIGSEDSAGTAGTPNANQLVQYNYVYTTAQGGNGYYRSQTALGLYNTGSAVLSAGVAASGGAPTATEYSGVTYSNNTICGSHSKLQPCTSGCSYTRFYGSVVVSNVCSNGCNNTPVTGICSPIGGGGGPPAPVISSFTASPASIAAGSSSTLAWTTSNATSLSINLVVVTGTSTTVSPTATTDYALKACNSTGCVTASLTVTVAVSGPTGAPTISAFSCSPAAVIAGTPSVCAWTTTGQTSLSIKPGVGVVTATTSVTLIPAGTTTYTLTAINASGSTDANATVTVTLGSTLGSAAAGSWPTVPTTQNLFQAADYAQTSLALPMSDVTLGISLASNSTFVPYQIITVDSEQMQLCSLTTICSGTRGLAGTTAIAHNTGAFAQGRIAAIYHNRIKNEIEAVETDFHANHIGYGHFGGASINGSCWPNSVANDACLYVATDNAIAKLTAPASNADTSFAVDSSAWFLSNEIGLVDSELFKIGSVSAGTLGSLTRGVGGTTAASHASNAQVTSVIAFMEFYAIANELAALEADTFGNTGSTVSCPCSAGAGVSWPNHAITLAEMGVDTNPGVVTAAMHNRVAAEIIAYLTDVHLHP